jgi:hypothetical protein
MTFYFREDIDRAVDFCGWLDRSFLDRIGGAPAEEIERVEELLRRPLVPQHRRYLELLGASTGGLDFGELDSSAATLERSLASTYGEPEPGYTLFAVGDDEPYEDLYLVERNGNFTLELLSTRVGAMHETLGGDAGIIAAGSISELMCMRMLEQRVLARMRSQRSYGLPSADASEPAGSPLLDQFSDVARQLRLPTRWFSSAVTRIAASDLEAPDSMVATARQGPRQPFQLTVSGYDEQAVIAAGQILARELGLVRLGRY